MKVITRMVPERGIELDGVLAPNHTSRLRWELDKLTIPAGGRIPNTYVPFRCIPAANAGRAQALQDELAEPEERGPVFIPLALLGELAEQDPWASAFELGAFSITDAAIARALIEHGLAVHETRGGYHGTGKLSKLLAELAGNLAMNAELQKITADEAVAALTAQALTEQPSAEDEANALGAVQVFLRDARAAGWQTVDIAAVEQVISACLPALRTLVHCLAGGLGADWSLDAAVALARKPGAQAAWQTSGLRLGHELLIRDPDDGEVYQFYVRKNPAKTAG